MHFQIMSQRFQLACTIHMHSSHQYKVVAGSHICCTCEQNYANMQILWKLHCTFIVRGMGLAAALPVLLSCIWTGLLKLIHYQYYLIEEALISFQGLPRNPSCPRVPFGNHCTTIFFNNKFSLEHNTNSYSGFECKEQKTNCSSQLWCKKVTSVYNECFVHLKALQIVLLNLAC